MNWLAHAFLSDGTPAGVLGNLLGDFVKRADEQRYTDAERAGIELHRRIDAFTDAHPVVRRSIRRLNTHPALRPILVDVFYDHLLARNWDTWCGEPLEPFVDWVYAVLQDNADRLPPRFQSILPYLTTQNWFVNYRHMAGIRRVLTGLSRRLRRPPADLLAGADAFEAALADYHTDFTEFLPQLQQHVADHCPATPPWWVENPVGRA